MRELGAFLASGFLAVACGGAQFDGREYQNDELAFRVDSVPQGWRSIEVEEALLAFRDDEASATIAVFGRCGDDGDDVPLSALTHHLFLHFTEREMMEQTTLTLDGRDAMRSRVRAKLDGVEQEITVYVLKKNSCVYDFHHITPPRESASPDFDRFVRGFASMRP